MKTKSLRRYPRNLKIVKYPETCFGYCEKGYCTVLQSTYCTHANSHHKCAFYKTCNQIAEEHIKTANRLAKIKEDKEKKKNTET